MNMMPYREKNQEHRAFHSKNKRPFSPELIIIQFSTTVDIVIHIQTKKPLRNVVFLFVRTEEVLTYRSYLYLHALRNLRETLIPNNPRPIKMRGAGPGACEAENENVPPDPPPCVENDQVPDAVSVPIVNSPIPSINR